MSKGYVYILSNPSMPGLLKIGKTTRSVEQRCCELYVTGVPTPFEVVAEMKAPDCGELERYVHRALASFRVSDAREFFAVEASKAVLELENGHNEQVELLVEEFKPDHVLVESDMFVDPGELSFLAYKCGIHPFELASALHHLEPEDVFPAVSRWREIVSKYKLNKQSEGEF